MLLNKYCTGDFSRREQLEVALFESYFVSAAKAAGTYTNIGS